MSQAQAPQAWQYQNNWLSGFRFDSLFIFGVLGVALLSGFIVWHNPALFAPVLFLDLWFLGYHHVISTFTKLAGTPEDRAENKFLIYQLPFLVILAVIVLARFVGLWSIITIYFFWQWYHYVRQSYGVSSFYHRKAEFKIEEPKWLNQATLWSIPVWGLLYRCHQGWDKFLGQEFWTPYVPGALVVIAGLVSLGLLGYWVLTRFLAFSEGRLPLGQTMFMASHFTAFYVGYIFIPDINIGWLVANIWHNAQYILFVWLYNTNRFKNVDNDSETVIAWASQIKPVRIMAYFVGCLIITTILYKSLMIGFGSLAGEDVLLLTTFYVVAFQTINFHHYIVDSLIWKARKKKHQQVMGIKSS